MKKEEMGKCTTQANYKGERRGVEENGILHGKIIVMELLFFSDILDTCYLDIYSF